MKRNIVFLLSLIALVAILGFGVALSPALSALAQGTATATPAVASTPTQASTLASPSALSGTEAALENIYTQVNPSVVLIQVVTGSSNRGFQGGGQALGSGFVWDTQGDIVTNNHVIDGASQVTVTFSDGTTVPATVVGKDPDSDLAVVKVNVPASQLHPVQLADSTQLKVGQTAIAIGNPYGEQNTMTAGIISAIGRSLPVTNQTAQSAQGSYVIPDVIQTDAAINPGNSGGVLLNDQGQVIGVTQSIESQSGASAGVGFAIPSQIVNQVVPALIKTGHYDHPYLGIGGTSLTPGLAQAMNLSATQRGALVISVTAGSPAEKAGLKGSTQTATVSGQQVQVGGDVITAIDNTPVKTFDDLAAYLANSTKVGQTVTLTILRGGQQQSVQVTLAARPASQVAQTAPRGNNPNGNNPFGNGNPPFGFPPFGNHPRGNNPANPRGNTAPSGAVLGITGVTLSSQIAQAMNVPTNQQGVLVEQVEAGSGAAKAGLQGSSQTTTINGQTIQVGGDIITAVDSRAVTNVSGLQNLLRQDKVGQVVTVTILRNGKSMDLKVTLGSSM
ncbi:MAG: trypsin-like peptidase domain-containing protein [Chloroflexi bacterium]|nr:trypsin-like peptidase domain-containing protein [Chloroflexota bacterium]